VPGPRASAPGGDDRRGGSPGEYTRYIEFGISPRAGVFLLRSAAAKGLLENRSYILPDDVKAVAHRVLRHRIVPSYEAEAEEISPDMIIDMVLAHVPVP
jgi:MoxR-like ATPase